METNPTMAHLHILFLSVNSELINLVSETLHNQNIIFDFNITENSNNVLNVIETTRPQIIVTDPEFLSRYSDTGSNITKDFNGVPVIIISETINNERGIKYIKQGAHDYLKCSDIEKIGVVIDSALEKKILISRMNFANQEIENYKRSNHILNEINDEPVLKITTSGAITDANSSVCRLSGYSSEELKTKNISELIVNSELTIFVILENRFRNTNNIKSEQSFITKSGKVLKVELTLKKIDDRSCYCIINKIAAGSKLLRNKKITQYQLLDIVEHSANLFYAHDVNGKFTYVSPKARELFDCNPDDFNKLTANIFTDNPINESGRKKTQMAIETGIPQPSFELELIGKERRIVWVEVNEVPITKNGKTTGIVGALTDITESKQISDRLIQSEKKFRTLFTQAPDGILQCDANGIITDCNKAFCNLTNNKKDKLLESSIGDYLFLNSSGDLELNANTFEKSNIIERELHLHTNNDHSLVTRCSASAQQDSNGVYSGAIIHIYNITDHKKNQLELIEREEQLSTLINSSPDIICFKDSAGRWQMANRAILNLFKLKNKDFHGKTNLEIAGISKIYSTYYNNCNDTDEATWLKRKATTYEESVKLQKGKVRIFEIIKVPIFSGNGDRKALVVIGRDITKRKGLETQLLHSQKMEAIGLMASGIAHNFNNILQAIVGYIDFAKEGLDEKSQRFADIDQIEQHVKRATMLTKNLLAVGKEQFMHKNEIDVNDIIRPIVELTNRYNKDNISVEFDEEPELPVVEADGGQIDQVIMNLFINARDAMPDGGKITVVTSKVHLDKDFCNNNGWAKPGDYVKISVSDTGHGMDSDTKRRIFEPYFTTKDFDKGTGLGLSTAFGIISQHNGMFNVKSKKHIGTTFEIFLPL